MADTLWLLVCENHRREAEAVLASGDFPGVSLASFPATCGQPPLGWAEAETALRRAGWEGGKVHVLGGGCLVKLGEAPPGLPAMAHPEAGHCAAAFAGRTLVEHCLGRNAYLMTPGWLRRWRHYMERWGLDSAGAKLLFGESTALLILLDTGVSPGSADQLRECAAFVGLPCESVPVGLDFFRLLVAQLSSEWRLGAARSGFLEELARASSKTADYHMALDLIGNLAGAMSEEEAAQGILDLFTTLFAPSTLLFARVEGGRLARSSSRPPELPADTEALKAFFAGGEEQAPTADGAGFSLRIPHRNETLGVIAAGGLGFPEHREQYLTLARDIARVCGLALSNARTYEALGITVRELQAVLDKVKVLKGMIPICSYCKNIRDDQGYWQAVELYVRDHSDATFTHGMCPECIEKHWKPQVEASRRKE